MIYPPAVEEKNLVENDDENDSDDFSEQQQQETKTLQEQLNKYLDQLDTSRTRLLPNQETILPVLNSGVIGGDLIGMIQYFGMCRAVFECLRVTTSSFQDKAKPIYSFLGIDQGVFNFATYFGTQYRARFLKRQEKIMKQKQQIQKNSSNLVVDFFVLDHRTGPIVHYLKNPLKQMIKKRFDVAKNKTVTEYLNCKDKTYAIVHQLDRHHPLFYNY